MPRRNRNLKKVRGPRHSGLSSWSLPANLRHLVPRREKDETPKP
jgi:hypothetical protein